MSVDVKNQVPSRKNLHSMHEDLSNWAVVLNVEESDGLCGKNVDSNDERGRCSNDKYVHESIHEFSKNYRPLSMSFQQWQKANLQSDIQENNAVAVETIGDVHGEIGCLTNKLKCVLKHELQSTSSSGSGILNYKGFSFFNDNDDLVFSPKTGVSNEEAFEDPFSANLDTILENEEQTSSFYFPGAPPNSPSVEELSFDYFDENAELKAGVDTTSVYSTEAKAEIQQDMKAGDCNGEVECIDEHGRQHDSSAAVWDIPDVDDVAFTKSDNELEMNADQYQDVNVSDRTNENNVVDGVSSVNIALSQSSNDEISEDHIKQIDNKEIEVDPLQLVPKQQESHYHAESNDFETSSEVALSSDCNFQDMQLPTDDASKHFDVSYESGSNTIKESSSNSSFEEANEMSDDLLLPPFSGESYVLSNVISDISASNVENGEQPMLEKVHLENNEQVTQQKESDSDIEVDDVSNVTHVNGNQEEMQTVCNGPSFTQVVVLEEISSAHDTGNEREDIKQIVVEEQQQLSEVASGNDLDPKTIFVQEVHHTQPPNEVVIVEEILPSQSNSTSSTPVVVVEQQDSALGQTHVSKEILVEEVPKNNVTLDCESSEPEFREESSNDGLVNAEVNSFHQNKLKANVVTIETIKVEKVNLKPLSVPLRNICLEDIEITSPTKSTDSKQTNNASHSSALNDNACERVSSDTAKDSLGKYEDFVIEPDFIEKKKTESDGSCESTVQNSTELVTGVTTTETGGISSNSNENQVGDSSIHKNSDFEPSFEIVDNNAQVVMTNNVDIEQQVEKKFESQKSEINASKSTGICSHVALASDETQTTLTKTTFPSTKTIETECDYKAESTIDEKNIQFIETANRSKSSFEQKLKTFEKTKPSVDSRLPKSRSSQSGQVQSTMARLLCVNDEAVAPNSSKSSKVISNKNTALPQKGSFDINSRPLFTAKPFSTVTKKPGHVTAPRKNAFGSIKERMRAFEIDKSSTSTASTSAKELPSTMKPSHLFIPQDKHTSPGQKTVKISSDVLQTSPRPSVPPLPTPDLDGAATLVNSSLDSESSPSKSFSSDISKSQDIPPPPVPSLPNFESTDSSLRVKDFTSPLPFSSSATKSTFRPIKFSLRKKSNVSTSSDSSGIVPDGDLIKDRTHAKANPVLRKADLDRTQLVKNERTSNVVSNDVDPDSSEDVFVELPATGRLLGDEGTCNADPLPLQEISENFTSELESVADEIPSPIEKNDTAKAVMNSENETCKDRPFDPALQSNDVDPALQSPDLVVEPLNNNETHSELPNTNSDDACSSEARSNHEERTYTDDDIDDLDAADLNDVDNNLQSSSSTQLIGSVEQVCPSPGLSKDDDQLISVSDAIKITNSDNQQGTLKPSSEDFVLPPQPSSQEETFTSHATFQVTSPEFYEQQNTTQNRSWEGAVDDFPLPPPPEDLPVSPPPPPENLPVSPPPDDLPVSPPPAISPTSTRHAEKPKGFRSVSRPVVKLDPTEETQLVLPKSGNPQLATGQSDTVPACNGHNNLSSKKDSTPSALRSSGFVALLRDTRKILIKPLTSSSPTPSNILEQSNTVTTVHGKPFPTSHAADVSVTPSEQLPTGAVYQTTTKEGDVVHTDTYYPARDQDGGTDSMVYERTKTTKVVQAPHHQGIGPVNDSGVPCALKTTVDDSKHWYKNMFKQMHKVDATNEEKAGQETELRSHSADSGHSHHSSTEVPKPKKVGRIFDYKPSQPYVVENQPVKLNLDHRPNYLQSATQWKGSHGKDSPNKLSRSSSLEEFSKIKWNDYFEDIEKPKTIRKIWDSGDAPDSQNEEQQPLKTSVKPHHQPTTTSNYVPSYVTSPKEVEEDYPEPKRVVKMKTSKPKTKPQPRKSPEADLRTPARAKFDFVAQTAKEYSVKKGQTVIITRQVDSNWCMVQSVDGSKSGIIPVSYLEIISGTTPEKPLRNGQARAKFDYDGSTKSELSFKKGDEIILLKRVDENWYKGKLSGKVGILPAVYVEILMEPETSAKKKEPTLPKQSAPRTMPSHSNQSSSLSQASSDEPDEKERMQRAAFLANSVIKSATPLHSHEAVHREDFLDAVIMQEDGIKDKNPAPQADQDFLNLSELDRVAESLSKGSKPSQPLSPPSSHLTPPTNPLTPSIPSYPSSSISSQTSSPRPATPPTVDYGQVIGTYVTLYTYEASNEDELDLLPGDVVSVVETCDDGWFVGTCQRTGVFGTFPGNYVTLSVT